MQVPSIETSRLLSGVRLNVAGSEAIYETRLALPDHRWLSEHRVAGLVIVPGAVLTMLARSAVEDCFRQPPGALSVALQAPLVLSETETLRVQVVVAGTKEKWRASIHSQPERAGGAWTHHVSMEPSASGAFSSAEGGLDEIRKRCSSALRADDVYERFAALGLGFGETFRTIKEVWSGSAELVARVVAPGGDAAGDAGVTAFVLDAAFQASLIGLERLHVPFAISRLAFEGAEAAESFIHVRLADSVPADTRTTEVTIFDARGRVWMSLAGAKAKGAGSVDFSFTTSDDPTSRASTKDLAASLLEAEQWRKQLGGLSAGQRAERVRSMVLAEVANLVSLPGPAKASVSLKELGVNSLKGVQLRNALSERVGLPLPATLVFDYPTPAAIADYILAQVVGAAGAGEAGLLREIDRLSEELEAFRKANGRAPAIVNRLQKLASTWAAAGSEEPREAAQKQGKGMQSLSDDDLLDLVDATLAGLEAKQ